MADTKTKKVAKKATHPKYNEMIAAALASLAEKGGSSRLAILKYISTKYKVSNNQNLVNSQLKLALKKGVAAGTLTQVKGTGASGSFKLSKKAAAPKTKAAKKPAKKVVKPKSPKAKKAKSPKKATPKKPKVKKSPKKVSKPKPKKPAAKKPAKKAAKPKAKKPAKKAAKK